MRIWPVVGKRGLKQIRRNIVQGRIVTCIDLPPSICCVWFVKNTLFIWAATKYLANRVPTANRGEGFILDEVENIFPRVPILEFEF